MTLEGLVKQFRRNGEAYLVQGNDDNARGWLGAADLLEELLQNPTRQYYDGAMEAILDVLQGIDAGWDLETVTNHCEVEVAELARVRREKFG